MEQLGDDLKKLDPVSKSFVDFTEKEVRDAIISLGCFKAPGPDGIPGVALHCTVDILMPFWLKLFNGCGRLGYFPAFWKRDVTVVIPKPGKTDYTVPKAYRPISLLSQLGKTLERLYVMRVNRLHREVGVFSENQHGFMLERSCTTAIDSLLGFVYGHKEKGSHALMMNLDVAGAFNRTWHCAILRGMLARNVPAYIIHMVKSFLRDRVVRLKYGGVVVEEETPDGCPQGAVFSPMLFKLVQELVIDAFAEYNRQLSQRPLEEVEDVLCDNKLVNFADDSTVVFGSGCIEKDFLSRREAKKQLSRCASDFLTWFVKYCKDLHLEYSVDKTKCMFFWEKHERPENLPITIDCLELGEFHGLQLDTLHEDPVRLLGVYLDPFLDFNAHVDKVLKKTEVGINMMRALAGSGWGMRGKLLKIVFNGLIESVLFYGLEVWGHAALRKRNLTKFRRVFAQGARAICRGSRSANFQGLMACAGVIPPEFRIRQLLGNRYTCLTSGFRPNLTGGRSLDISLVLISRLLQMPSS